MRSLAIALAVGMSACSGSTPPVPDGGLKCTMALYDMCNTEHDCTSGICQEFMAAGFQVCSTGCNATMPCANDSKGKAGTCDPTLSLCVPSVPNDCHL